MSVERSFPPLPESVREARLFVLDALPGLGQPIRERIALIVSELATNAVLHGATAFTVALSVGEAALTIEVTDQGGGRPEPQLRPPPPTQLHGRGLLLVSRLAHEWGVDPGADDHGKTVWARLTLGHRAAAAQARLEADGSPAARGRAAGAWDVTPPGATDTPRAFGRLRRTRVVAGGRSRHPVVSGPGDPGRRVP